MRQVSRVSLRDILYIVFRDKNRILLVTLLALVISLVYLMFQSSIYVAESRVLVRVGKEKLAGMESLSKDNYNILFQERGQDIHNGLEMLKDKKIAMEVLNSLKPLLQPAPPPVSLWGKLKQGIKSAWSTVKGWMYEPLYWFGFRHRLSEEEAILQILRGALAAEAIEDTDVVQISFGWTDPHFAAMAANEFARQFVSHYIGAHRNPDSEPFYREQISSYKKTLDQAEAELSEFQVATGIANISLEKEIVLNSIAELEAELRDVAVAVGEYRGLSAAANRASERNQWVQTPAMDSGLNSSFSELDAQYLELITQRQQLATVMQKDVPELRLLQRRIHGLRNEKASQLLAYYDINLAAVKEKRDLLQRKLKEKQARLRVLTENTGRLEQLVRLRNIAAENYLLYTKKAEELRISDELTNRSISGVRIVNEAVPPAKPSYPRRGLIVGLATLFGLFLGVGLSAVREYFNQTFRETGDVERILGVPLLMTVPKA